MMGKLYPGESLFYTFRLEEYVPKNHLLRSIDEHIDLSFVRQKLAPFYSSAGRPSIDPEVLIRILLIGYFYGVTSERRLVEEVGMHVAYRWFTGLDFNQTIPDHSTFSKNRHKRFKESGIFRAVFEEIVRRCIQEGLVDGKNLSADGTIVVADASRDSRIPRDQLAEAAKVSKTVQQYLEDLEKENPVNETPTEKTELPPGKWPAPSPKEEAETVSTTDPDAAWSVKRGQANLGYLDTYLMDNKYRVIIGVEATPAFLSLEVSATKNLIEQAMDWGFKPESLGADKAYGSGSFLNWLLDRHIAPHIPVIEHDNHPQNRDLFSKVFFTYDKTKDAFMCPNAQWLKYRGLNRQAQLKVYSSSEVQCRGCPFKKKCTRGKYRQVKVHWYEEARDITRSLHGTSSYAESSRKRKRIEGLFGELKTTIRLRRVRLRRLWNVAEQFFLAATVQNIKRLVKVLNQRQRTIVASTA